MPLSGAERQKRYMERLKLEKPSKFEEKRIAHLEKVKQRNIKIADLSEEEKLIQRSKWRDANKKKKLRKDEKTQKEKEEKLKQIKEKRAAAENIKLKKKNILLESKIEQLNRKINCLKKNLYRTKKNLHQLKDQINSQNSVVCISEDTEGDTRSQNMAITPNSKTNYFIDSLSNSVTDDDRNKIKRKVFELNVLSEALKSEYSKAETNDTKRKFKGIVNNDITQKYQMKTNLSQKLGLQGRVRIKQSQKQPSEVKNEDIKNFFLRDDVSRSTAGKKETKTLKKVKVQKRFLNDTLDNLYETKYKKEGGKASRTTFGRYKPFYVILITPNANDRDTCLCTKHTNLKMKAEKLKVLGVIRTTSYSELIDEITCDKNSKICMYSECESCNEKTPTMDTSINNQKETSWYKWVLKSHEYSKHQPGSSKGTQQMITKKYTKDLISGSVEMLVKEFVNELRAFKRHYFNVGIQESAFKMCRETIKDDEIVLICDFSENYACKMSEEIQSAHFGASKNQFTLQTGVIYTKANEPQSFCTISPSNCHDPGAIWAHLKPAIDLAKNLCPSARVLHIWSDGPTTQYRQKKNFYLFNKVISEDIFDYATWSYFEASHGKGPADGVGGAIKRKLDDHVAYGHDVPSAEVAYDLLESQESDVIKFYISEENITKMQDLIPDNLLALPGTMKVHQIIVNNSESVFYRDVSCFCGTENRGLCQCYDRKEHSLIPKEKNIKRAIPKPAKQQNCNKRRNKSNSSDTEIDSDVTYADTSEYEGDEISIVELDGNDLIEMAVDENEVIVYENEMVVGENEEEIVDAVVANKTVADDNEMLREEIVLDKMVVEDILPEMVMQGMEINNNMEDQCENKKKEKEKPQDEKENKNLQNKEGNPQEKKETPPERKEKSLDKKDNIQDEKETLQDGIQDEKENEEPQNKNGNPQEKKETPPEKKEKSLDKKDHIQEEKEILQDEKDGIQDEKENEKPQNKNGNPQEKKESPQARKEKSYGKKEGIQEEKDGTQDEKKKAGQNKDLGFKILSNVPVQMILDEKTGKLKCFTKLPSSNVIETVNFDDNPNVTETEIEKKFVLAQFKSKNGKRTYQYVCRIEESFSNEKMVVQGLKSKKCKKLFKLVVNDISIIDKNDVIAYLPQPIVKDDVYIFTDCVDVKEQ